jgi:response regulator NasT
VHVQDRGADRTTGNGPGAAAGADHDPSAGNTNPDDTPPPGPENASAPESPSPPSSRRRVLIAEDEALIRLDLAEMLTDEGFEVVGEATDGVQAVELAVELQPDLLILDVKMPRKDGIDAAAEIVAAQIAPVVILTAFSQRDLVERARDAGAMAYLVKPFSQSDLVPAIELAVARFAELSALRTEVADVTHRLEVRKLLDRAKGLLMARQRMTEQDAFRWIQRAAMDRRTSMEAVAAAIVEGLATPEGQRSPDRHRG